MLSDLKHSLRALRRTPMSSLSGVCILAVAIGASAAVFSVVDKVLIRPLPIDEPHRVVVTIGLRILPPGQGLDEQGQPRWAMVVGVVQDARYRGINDLRYDLYLPEAQIPGMRVKHLMVRSTIDPASLTGPIRAEARRLDATALVENAAVMSSLVEHATAPWRFSAWTIGLLGLLALTLAAFGLFATLSQSVVERTREIGIRVAVGALPRQVLSLVFREGLALTVAGIAIGSIVAALSRQAPSRPAVRGPRD